MPRARIAFALFAAGAFAAAVARGEAPAAAPAATRVAVLDIRAAGVDDATARTFSEILAVEVSRLPLVQVITNAEVQSLLGLEAQKQMVGCDENASCVAEIAGALGVEKLCTGSIGKVEDTTVLTLRVIDVKSARVDTRLYETERSGAAAFIGRMPDIVAKLFPNAARAKAEPAPVAKSEPKSMLDSARERVADAIRPPPRPPEPAVATAPAAPVVAAAPVSPTPKPAPAPAPLVAPEPPKAVAQPPAKAAQPSLAWRLAKSKWAWAAVGTLLIVGGSSTATANPKAGGTLFLAGLGAGVVSLGLCMCPWTGSGGDEPVTVIHPPEYFPVSR